LHHLGRAESLVALALECEHTAVGQLRHDVDPILSMTLAARTLYLDTEPEADEIGAETLELDGTQASQRESWQERSRGAYRRRGADAEEVAQIHGQCTDEPHELGRLGRGAPSFPSAQGLLADAELIRERCLRQPSSLSLQP
jgi:hypothetical protein